MTAIESPVTITTTHGDRIDLPPGPRQPNGNCVVTGPGSGGNGLVPAVAAYALRQLVERAMKEAS